MNLNVTKTLATVGTITALVGSIAGGLWTFDARYTQAAEFKTFQLETQRTLLEDKLDRTQERIWRVRDRQQQSESDREYLRKLEEDKRKTENQLKSVTDKLMQGK